MRTWKIACSAAALALGLASAAHADEYTKLTYFTFSGPVAMPGITLPAGTYRFELADPDSGRRVIRVSDKDGSKQYGMFLSVSDRKLEPSDNAVVMFGEMPAGMPQAVRAYFYPGETFGYEFVYPHDQALKIAKATHQPVAAMAEDRKSTTDDERTTSMKSASISHIDENDRPVSSDEALKDSSSLHPSNAPAKTTTASNTTTEPQSSASQSATAQSTTASNDQSNTRQPAAQSTTAQPTTAAANTADSVNARNNTTATRGRKAHAPRSVGTSGTMAQNGQTADTTANNGKQAQRSSRRHLPRTAGELPLIELLSGLAFAGGFSVRSLRRR